MTEASTSVRLLILGLPGIVTYFLCIHLIARKKRSVLETTLLVFVYSFFAYSMANLLAIIYNLIPCTNTDLVWKLSNLYNPKNVEPISIGYLIASTICGIILSYLLTYANTYRLANKFAQKISATNRYGDHDVWSQFILYEVKKNLCIYIFDRKLGFTYFCKIAAWSGTEEKRELVLQHVYTYRTKDSKPLRYDTFLYISREDCDLELRIPPEQNTEHYKFGMKQKESTNE